MRKGDTILFDAPPVILAQGAVGGKKEGEGPMAAQFDLLFPENSLGEPTWEQAESRLQQHCLDLTLQKARLPLGRLNLVLGGDLQNQCTATAYHMSRTDVPFAGLYGACSTMAEALGLAACLAAGGCVEVAAALASSHFCAAERQFRTPLSYGGKRTPTAQWTATAYHMSRTDVPFAGLYGACSTMAEALGLAACLAAGGCVEVAAALASSHFCAAERQFRTPLSYGGKRTPTAQWTATAAGCCLVAARGAGPRVASVTFGRVRDYAVTDLTNMGGAMAPAAAETILRHCADTGRTPADFDAVYTGDLGLVGSRLLAQLLEAEGLEMKNHTDCGLEIYDIHKQEVQAGGSGAGCSAAVLCARVLPALRKGKMRRVLFLSTGALMSQITSQQGMSIPGVAHLVELVSEEAET